MSGPILIADLFCGAGGTSAGAVRALNRLGLAHELVCVNHWAVAIETHTRNHPEARHHCVDLATARPEAIVPEGRLDLLVASPTCTYHSRARAGKPTTDQQRMDPWHVVTWATSLEVDRIMVENVPEFMDWGPVDAETGKPDPSRRGEYFGAWIAALEAIGYDVESRILNCADYGDATTRQRFFLLGRRRGRPIRWPSPSHAPAEKAAALGRRPWRPAREIIDWSLPSESIFTRARPLSEKTLARIAAGLAKFGGAAAEPFLVVLRNHCDARGLDPGSWPGAGLPPADANLQGSLTGSPPAMVIGQHGGATARPVDRPVPTIATLGAVSLVEPFMVPNFGERDGQPPRVHALDDPLPTVTSRGAGNLIQPMLTAYYGANAGCKPVTEPMDTVTTKDRFGLVEPDAGPPVDIRYRMLQPHELAGAMSFDADYDFAGTKTEIKRQIGNAVPTRTAEALIGAAFAEEAGGAGGRAAA
ncbi:DNA cytosine methyltransferase [Minwuia thermotolerans]|uniref:DNA (cytosine-5-)-methyltransferase n=1 Tax=Minwuia thermotolerans TaxID=2056226 RepID=A0A2M9G2M6_9PROT|nr:DNA cytosine methyltransferase [Minwuia thermotolerans]PJK29936.1 DNA cytosine methyltransferase [Minwuia thermotolerans]